MINYTRDIFSPRIRNRSTLIDSLLDFDFYIRKNFINTVRLKILKTKEQARTNWVWNNETDFFNAFATDRDWQGLPLKSS